MELIEADAFAGHRVKIGRLHLRMAVVSHITPALIIRHHEHDIRRIRWSRERERGGEENKQAGELHGLRYTSRGRRV